MSGLLPASAASTLQAASTTTMLAQAAQAAGGQAQRISIEEAEAVQSMEVSWDITVCSFIID